MKIHMKAKGVTLTDKIESHFERKLLRMERFLGRDVEAYVNCVREKGQDRVEVTLHGAGIEMRAEEAATDLYIALDIVCDRLERQVEKYKTRLEQRRRSRESIRKGAREFVQPYPTAETSIDIDDDEDPDENPQIVRSKRFPFKPLDPEEACMQMELLGHAFFVFLNAETEEVNVVYKRKDGNYGLIEPE